MSDPTADVRERMARVLEEHQHSYEPTDTQGFEGYADALIAAGFGDVTAAEKRGAEKVVQAVLDAAPPINAELSMPGGAGPFVDRGMEAYIEGFHDAYDAARAGLRSGEEADQPEPPRFAGELADERDQADADRIREIRDEDWT